jgi:hypothetical protein
MPTVGIDIAAIAFGEAAKVRTNLFQYKQVLADLNKKDVKLLPDPIVNSCIKIDFKWNQILYILLKKIFFKPN